MPARTPKRGHNAKTSLRALPEQDGIHPPPRKEGENPRKDQRLQVEGLHPPPMRGIIAREGKAQPFETIAIMDLPLRLAYWGAVVPLTYAAGLFGATRIGPIFAQSALWLRLLMQGLASAVMVTLALMALNTALGLQSFERPKP